MTAECPTLDTSALPALQFQIPGKSSTAHASSSVCALKMEKSASGLSDICGHLRIHPMIQIILHSFCVFRSFVRSPARLPACLFSWLLNLQFRLLRQTCRVPFRRQSSSRSDSLDRCSESTLFGLCSFVPPLAPSSPPFVHTHFPAYSRSQHAQLLHISSHQ